MCVPVVPLKDAEMDPDLSFARMCLQGVAEYGDQCVGACVLEFAGWVGDGNDAMQRFLSELFV